MRQSLLLPMAAAVSLALAGPTVAAEATTEARALQLARAVEARASRSNFDQLERFGQDAMRQPGQERLKRLYHVAWLFLNQSEFERFDAWNDKLLVEAQKQRDRRYQSIALLNRLSARYDQGDTKAVEELRQAMKAERDWFAAAHAKRLWAIYLMDEGKVGDALRVLAEADAAVPDTAPEARSAHAGIWEVTGLALMSLNDLTGSVNAFSRFEFELADPTYPRPDFDSLYNLASLSTQVGDQAIAEQFYAAHHRLSQRTSLSGLKVWDANLCAMVADGADDARRILDCLAPLGEDLKGAEFLSWDILPVRAKALARTGQVAAAQRDVERMTRISIAEGSNGAFPGKTEVEAEILFAQGRHSEAFALLRKASRAARLSDAQSFSQGIHQVTGDMQAQLAERRSQLDTARRNEALNRDVITSQRWIMGIAGAFVLTAFGFLIWQLRQTRHLRVARYRAEAASRTKSEFLANMSHEIRTPLNGVVAMADALASSPLDAKEREMVEVIRSSGVTLERLLSDILDLARIESGQVTIEPTAFHLGDAVRGIAALSRLRADEKGIELKVDVDPAVDHVVMGDVVRVRQILTNLISNAVKFTEQGYVRMIAASGADGKVRLEVTDTGVGFDASLKSRVFGRFMQADGSITRRFGGTGLGLSISRQLASLMGGELDCDSAPGQGSRFWLDIPLPPASVEAAEAVTVATVTGEEATDRPLRILLADDHPTNRKVIELMLAETGVELTTVVNGQEALEAVRGGGFDLVLMDMQMPVMDGLTATREIRAHEGRTGAARLPVIMLTANALAEHVEAGREAGADGHVSKPVTMQTLFAAIEAALGSAAEPPAREAA